MQTFQQDGLTTTSTAKFIDSGAEEWLFVTTNKNNEVVGRFGGTNTRTCCGIICGNGSCLVRDQGAETLVIVVR